MQVPLSHCQHSITTLRGVCSVQYLPFSLRLQFTTRREGSAGRSASLLVRYSIIQLVTLQYLSSDLSCNLSLVSPSTIGHGRHGPILGSCNSLSGRQRLSQSFGMSTLQSTTQSVIEFVIQSSFDLPFVIGHGRPDTELYLGDAMTGLVVSWSIGRSSGRPSDLSSTPSSHPSLALLHLPS